MKWTVEEAEDIIKQGNVVFRDPEIFGQDVSRVCDYCMNICMDMYIHVHACMYTLSMYYVCIVYINAYVYIYVCVGI